MYNNNSQKYNNNYWGRKGTEGSFYVTHYFYKWNVDNHYHESVIRCSFKVKGTMEEKIVFLKYRTLQYVHNIH